MGIIQAEFDSAPIKCSPHMTECGRIVLVPDAVIEWFRTNGGGELLVKIPGEIGDESGIWLTLKEAASLYVEDRPDLSGLNSAKAIISKECKLGAIGSRGNGRSLRINADSFSAWRLEKQRNYLGKDWGNEL